jgi:hypothetical protein
MVMPDALQRFFQRSGVEPTDEFTERLLAELRAEFGRPEPLWADATIAPTGPEEDLVTLTPLPTRPDETTQVVERGSRWVRWAVAASAVVAVLATAAGILVRPDDPDLRAADEADPIEAVELDPALRREGRPAASGEATVLAQAAVGATGPDAGDVARPWAIAHSEAEGLWATAISPERQLTAYRLHPDSGEVLLTVPLLGRGPSYGSQQGIVLSGGYAWVTVRDNGVARIDAVTGDLTLVELGDERVGVSGNALAGSEDAVWVVSTDADGVVTVHRIDPVTAAVSASLAMSELDEPVYSEAVDLEAAEGQVWLSAGTSAARHLLRLDPTTLHATRHLVVPMVGEQTAADDLALLDGRLVVTEHDRTGLTVVDPAAGTVVAQWQLPTDRLVVDGDHVWVVTGEGQMTSVDPSTGALLRTVDIPPERASIARVGDDTFWLSSWQGRLVKIRVP